MGMMGFGFGTIFLSISLFIGYIYGIDDNSAENIPVFRKLPNSAFMEGERLVFSINYGIVRAGEGEMTIPEIKKVNGRESYRVLFTVRSVSPFSWFYRVDDRWETLIDREGLFPWQFSARIREGGYSRDFDVDFDQINNRAVTKDGEYEVPPYVHDIVSAFYFVRTADFTDLEPGDRISLKNFYKDSTYALDVIVHGREIVQVKSGTYRTVLVEPLVKESGLFRHEGAIYVWLTDDRLKVPVKVSTRIPLGSITAELIRYTGLRDAIRARVQ